MPYQTLQYAGSLLDRADAQRRDSDWLERHRVHPDTRLIPIWRNRNLFDTQQASEPLFAQGMVAQLLTEQAEELTFLGLEQGVAVFAADVSGQDEETLLSLLGGGRFIDMRMIGPMLEREAASLLAYARGMLYWHRQHRYCGRCGSATTSVQGGHVRRCSHTDCGRESYPRTDPAVIMLVEDIPPGGIPRCLLGRQSGWPPGVYSTLAGFVEPGESLENAVAREVLEEAGIAVTDARYQASQPWPFPSSLMLGFRARALSTEIHIDTHELEDARWFSADELRAAGEWSDGGEGLKLSRVDSISRALVDAWLHEQP